MGIREKLLENLKVAQLHALGNATRNSGPNRATADETFVQQAPSPRGEPVQQRMQQPRNRGVAASSYPQAPNATDATPDATGATAPGPTIPILTADPSPEVSCANLIARLVLAGVRLSVLGPDQLAAGPRVALTDELQGLIRENKAALLAALAPLERGREDRLQRALAKLAESDKKRVAVFDIDADPENVVCTVAIRDVGTCELRIPHEKYDPWAILEALAKAEQ